MNIKRLSTLVVGIFLLQTILPVLAASEVKQPTTVQAAVKYAPVHPTPEQVAAADPDAIVIFNDSILEAAVATLVSISPDYIVNPGEITVADMARLKVLAAYGGVTDLSGLEYAVNVTNVDLMGNQIVDISPLSNMKKLHTLVMINNNVNDISTLASLPNLKNIQFQYNNISDFSPLSQQFNDGAIVQFMFNGQVIDLPDKIVTTNENVTFDVIGFNGQKYPVSLGTPVKGENNLSGTIELTIDAVNSYSATVNQKVIYRSINGDPVANTLEGTPLTDDQLISKFNVISDVDKPITVNQSTVNYDVPGEYKVTFATGEDTMTSVLTVEDIKPKLTLKTRSVSIKTGESIVDYIASFGATATEITNGDLTAKINVVDSLVDYDSIGTYDVLFTVTDDEGTTVKKSGNVVIEENTVVTPTDIASQVSTTDPTPEITKVATTRTNEKQQNLASTGNYSTIAIFGLAYISIILITFKKLQISDK